jgi:hypothetical protein
MNATVEAFHQRLADACEDSARNWRQLATQLLDIDLQLAAFAHSCALDNERIAEEERKAK